MRRFVGLLVLAAATLVFGGCGDDEPATPPANELQAIADGLTEDVFVGTGTVNIFPQPAGDLGVLRDVLRAQARRD